MLTSKFKQKPLGKDGRGGWTVIEVNSKPAPDFLRRLRIPPAWYKVKVTTFHIPGKAIVTGYDEAGRRQYLYHPNDVADNKAAKFKRVMGLLEEWDDLQAEIQLGVKRGIEEALVAKLIYNTGMRPGGDGDTRAQVKAYGATTLLLKHVKPAAKGCRLKFIGKKGVPQNVLVKDQNIAKVLLNRKETSYNGGYGVSPRTSLFQTDAGKLRQYFRTLGSGQYTPKDFRTACGTRLALELLGKRKLLPKAKTKRKKLVNDALDKVAKQLGNTRAISRSAYVDPQILVSILDHDALKGVELRQMAESKGIRVPKGANDRFIRLLIEDHNNGD